MMWLFPSFQDAWVAYPWTSTNDFLLDQLQWSLQQKWSPQPEWSLQQNSTDGPPKDSQDNHNPKIYTFKNMLQVVDLLGMVRTEDLARTVPTNSSQPPSLWPMQWSASLWLLSFNKAFSIIIHSVFVKLGNVSYGQDFTLEAILFLTLELDSHRYGAGASLWPKN